MTFAILMMCTVFATRAFATMFLAIWSSRRDGSGRPSLSQNRAAEFVWAAIPCQMIRAAAIPVSIAIAFH